MSAQELGVVALIVAVVVGTLVLTVVLLVRLVRARRVLREAGLPMEKRLAFWAAVAYVVWPVDLLPDPILLDDIGALLFALRTLHAAAQRVGAAGGAGGDAARLPGSESGPGPGPWPAKGGAPLTPGR